MFSHPDKGLGMLPERRLGSEFLYIYIFYEYALTKDANLLYENNKYKLV